MKFLYFSYGFKIYGTNEKKQRSDIDTLIDNNGVALKTENKFIFENMGIVVDKDVFGDRYLREVKEIAIIFDNAQEKCDFLKNYEAHKNTYRKIKLLKSLKKSSFPKGVIEELNSWEIVSKSPYSSSFYNTNNISWGYKPEGSLRISNHWNFESCGEKHCRLNTTEEYIHNTWILARYNNGIYEEIKRF